MEWPKSKNNKMEELLERMSQFEANLAQLISTGIHNHTPSPATDEATSSPNEQEQLSPEQEEEMKLKIQELQQKEEELNLRAEKLDKLAKELEERQQNLENRNPNDERSIEPATHPDHSFPSQIGDQINALKKLLEDSSYKDKIIKDLHEELQSHNRDLHAEIVKPLLKNMIKMHERLTKTYKFYENTEAKSSPETYTRLLREVENCKLHIQDILEDEYDLEYFEPTIGSAYSPKEQTAIRTVITDTPEQAGTIKEFHYGGFRNTTTNKIFQPSTVTVYKKSE